MHFPRSCWLVICLGALALSACQDPPEPSSPEPLRLRLDRALERAASWMGRFPEEELRFDAAIGTRALLDLGRGEFKAEAARTRARAERDHDHPGLRFLKADFRVPAEAVQRWTPPKAGAKRINPNRPLHEALFCDVHGLRPEALAYIAGPMRDGGGYHSTHAAWALSLAKDRACVDAKTYAKAAHSLAAELAKAQPATFTPKKHLDVDLYAERIWALLLLDRPGDVKREWVEILLGHQRPDGSFGVGGETGERPYYRYHATLVSAWALALYGKSSAARTASLRDAAQKALP